MQTKGLDSAVVHSAGVSDRALTSADSGKRISASHVVDAELEHLEWATRQPVMRVLNAVYWRRRVLEVKSGYELTQQQGVRIERMLKQLADRSG
jgi:hypothetical protein